MRNFAIAALIGAAGLSLTACGGGDSGGNKADDVGQSVNAADGFNAVDDESGTTGSTTGDAGGPLNIAGDAANDAAEANGAGSEAH